ncbi:hypothetical protein PsexTeo8_37860 [Pseudomonas extremaustralis]|uniref:Uncharacterized protein n=1 Tax=Pseudomonas extremaustralis TaxID=359110 RepID=A0ABY0N054_9PSED|nr:hypothetical protein [Pseudomonas extremaustralis]SDE73486.1 hypothetical protein SAMN05216591_0775 [Pseudomonas extremaustralis]
MSDWLLKDYAVVMILPFVNKVFLSQVGEVFPPHQLSPPARTLAATYPNVIPGPSVIPPLG